MTAPTPPTLAGPADILLVADDLMFPSRVREGLRPLGYQLQTVGTETAVFAALAERTDNPPRALLVNLTARRYDPIAVIRRLRTEAPSIPVLAFAGHVETEKHAAARAAGADLVVANSSVALHLAVLLRRLIDGSTEPIPPEEPDAA